MEANLRVDAHPSRRTCYPDVTGGGPYLDTREPWWTSTIYVFEVLNGPAGSPDFDPIEERQTFGGVRALEFNELTDVMEITNLENISN